MGIGKATEQAVLAGIGSVPTPIAEQNWDGWLFWTPISSHSAEAGIARDTNFDLVLDSRAMRKISEEDAFYAAFEVVEIGTSTLDMFLDSRMLFALP